MKKIVLPLFALSAILSLSGCGMMEMSFKAGFIMALILAAIIGLLVWVLHISWKVATKYFPGVRLIFEEFLDE